MNSQPTIDKGIPIPSPKTGSTRHTKWPFPEMEVGDSFEYPGTQSNGCAMCATKNKHLAPKRFVCRKYNGKPRIWRVE
jgi:hypothetical protein